MKSQSIVFKYKGERDYIQGADVINAIQQIYTQRSLTKFNCSFHGFMQGPCVNMFISNSKAPIDDSDKYNVICDFNVGDKKIYIYMQDANNCQEPRVSYKYDESEIIKLCEIEGDQIKLNKKSSYTFIESIVAMTKHLHHKLFSSDEGKWIFTRLNLDELIQARENILIEIIQNLGSRLTKSDIYYKNKNIGCIYFSLVK